MAGRSCYRDVLPFAAMVTVESTNVGLNILFKSATTKGLSYYVFIVYSYAFATVLLLPLPFIFPSRTSLPPLNFSLLFKAFLLGLIGFVANICAYKGIDYSSPTLASAMSNLTPAFTFILAVIFRSLLDRLFCSLPCFLNSLLHSLRRLNRRKERVKVGSAAVGCFKIQRLG